MLFVNHHFLRLDTTFLGSFLLGVFYFLKKVRVDCFDHMVSVGEKLRVLDHARVVAQ